MEFLELYPHCLNKNEMKKHFKILLIPIFCSVLLFQSCGEKSETPIKGSLKCYVDESLFNVIQVEKDTFMVHYKQSKIELFKVKAREGIATILNGDISLFISSRNLNDEEKTYFEKTNLPIRAFKFCYDAVVPIVNKKDPADKVTMDEIKNFLSGKPTRFRIYVPEPNSGIYEYLKRNVLDGKELTNVSVVKSEEEVIQKIKTVKNALGFVGLDNAHGDEIKILQVGVMRRDGEALYYDPYVAYLISQTYPLVRTTAIIINDPALGVASGFASFLTSYEGQKIVSKNNLGPWTQKDLDQASYVPMS